MSALVRYEQARTALAECALNNRMSDWAQRSGAQQLHSCHPRAI